MNKWALHHEGRALEWRLPMWWRKVHAVKETQQSLSLPLQNVPKAVWKFFGAFAGVDMKYFKLTRGEIAFFRSSDEAMRGFCRDCGTPLAYTFVSQPRISVSIGSLDRHSEMKPEFQYGLESREPWLADVLELPGTITGDGDNGVGDMPARFEKIRSSCKQHPDHDTEEW